MMFNPNFGMVVIKVQPQQQKSVMYDPTRVGDDEYGEIVCIGPVADGVPCIYSPGDKVKIPPRGQRFKVDEQVYTVVFHMDIPFSVEG